MPDYIFKTYIDSGREYYEYTDMTDREQTIKKDFPGTESLMDLLSMDTQELEAHHQKDGQGIDVFLSVQGLRRTANRSGRLE